jgi:hypothetical protein
MPDTQITSLPVLTGANAAAADLLPVVDVSDPTQAASGSNKAIRVDQLGFKLAQWVEIEVDFGPAPQWSKTFTVTDANVSTTSRVAVVQSGNVATGRVGNDAEWDALICAATPASGSFTLTALAVPGPVVGRRKVQYQIAA